MVIFLVRGEGNEYFFNNFQFSWSWTQTWEYLANKFFRWNFFLHDEIWFACIWNFLFKLSWPYHCSYVFHLNLKLFQRHRVSALRRFHKLILRLAIETYFFYVFSFYSNYMFIRNCLEYLYFARRKGRDIFSTIFNFSYYLRVFNFLASKDKRSANPWRVYGIYAISEKSQEINSIRTSFLVIFHTSGNFYYDIHFHILYYKNNNIMNKQIVSFTFLRRFLLAQSSCHNSSLCSVSFQYDDGNIFQQ